MKYIVIKAETGEAVGNCFVLRPDKDPAAIDAIWAYAAATDNSVLAADLLRWVGLPDNDPLSHSITESVGLDCKSLSLADHSICHNYGPDWLAYRNKTEMNQGVKE